MPADRSVLIPFGEKGLNLSTSPAELAPGELSDTLNWQIDRAGALIKRLGMREWAVATPSPIVTLMQLAISGGQTYILAHCANGQVYSTVSGASWTSIDTGLSGASWIGWVQYLDRLYYCDGTNNFRQWDGTTLTAMPAMIKGRLMTIWRNRLWVAGTGVNNRTVYWSAAGAPTDFTTYPLNTVSFPDGSELTAIAATENVAVGADGSDGVLVFSRRKIRRIYDDTDNVAGAVVGGANTLVDISTGCVSRNSIASVEGRVFFLSTSGIYSTDGHAQAREESSKLRPLFATMSWDAADKFVGLAYRGRYLFAYSPTGEAENTLMLECYNDHSRSEDQFVWMAHNVPVRNWIRVTTAVGDTIYMVDASSGDTAYVRSLFSGGYDVTAAATQNPIKARALTGALLLGVNTPKRIRRVELFGRGQITVAIATDLSDSAGESDLFSLGVGGNKWNPANQWGAAGALWGPGGKATKDAHYYEARGRFFSFELTESSTATSSADRALGYAGAVVGGAAAYTVVAKIIPLDAD